MKKILILYFSGAGATLNSIKYMQTCINNITGCSAYIHSMENDLEENINNLMVYGSKFLQVHHGSNTFRYNADTGVDNLEAVIEYVNEYEAV